MNYLDAKAQCESDGAYLATPRSDAENDFIAGLLPSKNIWIGINDIDEEGKYVSVDGLDVSYTKWFPKLSFWAPNGQPDNFLNSNGMDEDGVSIIRSTWNDQSSRFWDDVFITNLFQFVCIYNLPSDYASVDYAVQTF